MPKYHIQSVQTSRYIINTTCDVPEQVVVTIDGSKGPPSPDNAILTVTPAIDPASPTITKHTISGSSGLYIGLDSNSKLTWAKEAYTWEIVKPKPGVYEIIPLGPNLYWFTDAKVQPLVEVAAGSKVVENENQWFIKAVGA